ncbi:MAG: hypothetical protein ACYDBJ_15380 [Aggregatilineales bacterium]
MPTQHLELKQDVIAVGTYGNVSVRVPEGLIVTPSRVDYSTLVMVAQHGPGWITEQARKYIQIVAEAKANSLPLP